jgi:hypothetical protein
MNRPAGPDPVTKGVACVRGIASQRHRTGQYKIVEPADVQRLDIQVERRLPVRRVEFAANRVPVGHQIQVECLLNIRRRPRYVEYRAIGMRSGHRQAVRFREIDESLVVVFGRAEFLGELLRR